MTELVQIQDDSGIRVIRMNRPERKNAITHAMYTAMADALNSAQTDPSIRVVVITGTGDSFTAGNDVGDFLNGPPKLGEGEERPVERFLKGILTAGKPLVAAVNGMAVGVGVTMLLHCDLVYAAEGAVFKAPFVDLGVVPEAASSYLMPQICGNRRTAELFLLGETFDTDKALSSDLINQVFSGDQLINETIARAAILAQKPPQALRNTKMLLKKNAAVAAERMLEESKIFGQALQGEEFREAGTAFMEKRKPDFSRFS